MGTEYWIVQGETTMELSERVSLCLENEWKLYGSPFVAKVYGLVGQLGINNNYCQAMVRTGSHPGREERAESKNDRLAEHIMAELGKDQDQELWKRAATFNDLQALTVAIGHELGKKADEEGYTVNVPVLPEFAPSHLGRFQLLCACLEKVGDNPECNVHSPGGRLI